MNLRFLSKQEENILYNNEFKGDQYFVDDSWFPHTTMELINNSDLVVNFDSSTIKEAIMLEKPILNFNALDNRRVYTFLYDHKFCVDLKKNEMDEKKILDGIAHLIDNDFSEEYSFVKNKYLWTYNSSKRILDYFGIGG